MHTSSENIELWGRTSRGEDIHRIKLSNADLTAHIITFGASLQDLKIEGHPYPLILGFESLTAYETHGLYFGATVGRCANRVAAGQFKLDGKTFRLDKDSDEPHHLHGGREGFFARVWEVENATRHSVTLRLASPDGDMGYPGNLTSRCTYALDAENGLSISYEAETDVATICNLVNHAYFNLEDGGRGDVNLHRLRVDADQYLISDETNAPTGEISSVSGTALDFRKLRPIDDFSAYDHNFCLSTQRTTLRKVALLVAHSSGIEMDVLTTETGLQFYGAGYIKPGMAGLDEIKYLPGTGLCLEAQIWPDAINQTDFPNSILRPNEKLLQQTVYRFRHA